MIHYDNQSWWGLVFRLRGTVLHTTWPLVLCIAALLLAVYWGAEATDLALEKPGHTIFGSTMSYLLVFRAHTASERYWSARTSLTQVCLGIREFVMITCVTIRGGAAGEAWRTSRASRQERASLEDANDIKASMARVNCIRWALAFVVSLKLHTRICHSGFLGGWVSCEEKWLVDFDRVRLRGLTTRQEFEELNDLIPIIGESHVTRGAPTLTPELVGEVLEPPEGSMGYEVDTTPDLRQPLAVLIKMRLEVMRHVNEPHGLKERFLKDVLALCNRAALLYESVTTVILTPIPFPYVHLCKVLLLIFLASLPFIINPSRGFFAGVVIPCLVAMSFLGIDAIATELENPFGDDPNDHDVARSIAALEAECMAMLELCGDTRAREAFGTCPIPEALREIDGNSYATFVCLRSQFRAGPPPGNHASAGRPATAGTAYRASSPQDGPTPESPPEEPESDDPRAPLLGGGGGGGGGGGSGAFDTAAWSRR
mmetsp:Transcript_90558/g.281943  ORF Transcript_90558/g.281943 Transcript_90558/m.281943 type:complete len:485 (+) Transcript_90558:114-1568(+)